jgi:hypothetical protein
MEKFNSMPFVFRPTSKNSNSLIVRSNYKKKEASVCFGQYYKGK